MFAIERQQQILEKLKQDGAVSVSKLSTEFSVAEETIRRDLEKLEKQEKLLRTHGGAIPVDDNKYEPSLEKRKKINVEGKERVAVLAAQLISPGETIFLDASTTTYFIARELKKMKNVTVITNSIRIIDELAGYDNIKLISVGGKVSQNQSFIGTISEDIIKEYFFASKVFFSSKGITEDVGILESNELECGIKQKMIENSSKRYYLCDKSKIGRVGFVKLCGFDKINTIITDADLDLSFKTKLDELKVDIIKI